MLRERGCADVLVANGINTAQTLLESRRPNLAVLDVNLAGVVVYPLAERLERAGVPFVFATGYGRAGMPALWAARPVVQKPFSSAALAAALQAALLAAAPRAPLPQP